ncbi:MAG: DUF1351 domain-containing protein [Lachnospiraceae bacterium]|nr:DUF1351 domain-containing protein [Lachnospiraceae bacterium]
MTVSNRQTEIRYTTYVTRSHWNFNELSEALDTALTKFRGKAYTEGQRAEAERDRTILAVFKKTLNDRRIQVEKELSSKCLEFNDQMNELFQMIDSVISEIDSQIEAMEDLQQDARELQNQR